MKKIVLIICIVAWIMTCTVSVFGQQPPTTPPGDVKATAAKPGDTKPTDAKPTDAKPAETTAPAPSPVPTTESWITGSVDLGYRWVTDGGSFPTYRTFVDLGSGPKLLGTEFTITDPHHRAFDYIKVRAQSWGGDPYQTFHVDAAKSKLYDFSADYRDIAYFNALPSYADPLLARGIALNEQAFDLHRRNASLQLEFRPGSWLIPYLAFDHSSGTGTGVTTFVTDADEFPIPTTLRDQTNVYRGGVRIDLRKFHVTLEEGGTAFKDDQSVFQNSGVNIGNVSNLFLGQQINLTSLAAAYGIRGTSTFSKVLFTANPISWLDLYGQFLYSQPDTSLHYQQADAGNLFLQSQFLFYASQSYLVSSAANLPHTTGSFGAEIRPMRRVRVTQSWLTDRLSNTGSASQVNQLTSSGVSQQIALALSSSLITNYNQAEANLFFDVTSKLMLRGGYRYVWGDASDTVLPPTGLVSSDQGKLRRNVAIGGFTYRPIQRVSFTAEAEVASSGGSYFRTSLYDYQKVRAQARYQALKALRVTADFTALLNDNPAAGTTYSYRAQQESLSLFWSPRKAWDFEGSYSRSTMRSTIGYLQPQDLSLQLSLYRDDTHSATALFNWKVPKVGEIANAKFTAGGALFVSAGSRPTRYYQPLATLLVPAGKHASLFAEWRYYGYGKPLFLLEGFRAHLFTTGVRLSR